MIDPKESGKQGGRGQKIGAIERRFAALKPEIHELKPNQKQQLRNIAIDILASVPVDENS